MKYNVVVASKNPVKVNAALDGLKRMFPEDAFMPTPVSVPSGVADQPMSDQETLHGALNRVENARASHPEADFWIGIEGGIEKFNGELAAFAWVVVQDREQTGKARSGAFFLPKAVQELVEQGLELGDADDQVFGHSNSKQKGGAIGLLTQNALDRRELYEQAVVLALVPFKNKAYYLNPRQEQQV
ncbi:inosine/xanthosine triphosphatase [Pontibacter akesuensis]|uniref:Probable inosine/xanthosine triphosphatase n=1 Tax=Pontibacter akesuensis TaxID=388950 RepID=A0A1I7GQ83_9BACT|nr:inosine/xanthosine triphosphatase [Pontibacter akesuensis]GHA55596.1 non-canonical purine NTP phosphatase [Pontibacter akesuensis]SFU50623.1 inosine/xanthosine triphosphatase [Pontibacter akesuensis]